MSLRPRSEVVLLCFSGALHVAVDVTAGEKERGTMETLLSCPLAREDLVLGKFLLVLTGALSSLVFSLVSMGTSLLFATRLIRGAAAAGGGAAAGAPLSVDPYGVLGVVLLVIPTAALFSAALFAVSLFARTTREAQSYAVPLVFLVLGPAMAGLLPGVELGPRLAFVPIVNLSLVCKEMLSGVWSWGYIALVFCSTVAYAAAALAFAVSLFKREDVMFRG
jgi:sodium transport system permease protein